MYNNNNLHNLQQKKTAKPTATMTQTWIKWIDGFLSFLIIKKIILIHTDGHGAILKEMYKKYFAKTSLMAHEGY